MTTAIQVTGLKEFRRGLKTIDRELPKALRVALNDVVQLVVDDARPRVPKRSGRARGSVKARSTQSRARIVGGSARAPYYGWLDFGGRVGRRRSVSRPVLADGRYIYNAYFRHRDEMVPLFEDALVKLCRRAGLEVT